MLHFLLHITGGNSGDSPIYLEFSGFVAIVLGSGFIVTWYKNSRCHVDGCHKHGKYPFQHYRLCHLHHPAVPKKITHLHIKKTHLDSLKQKDNTKDIRIK
jgi:hypothetical protein